MSNRTCQLKEGCSQDAAFDIISRDEHGNELSHDMCCFYHGIAAVNINHDYGNPIYDCVVTPVDGITLMRSEHAS